MQYEISFIPLDPYFIPNQDAVAKATEILESYFEFREYDVEVETRSQPHFFSTPDCWNFIVCPECKQKAGRDRNDQWDDMVSVAESATNALEHRVVMPCCGKSVSLTVLVFDDDLGKTAAIGRFRMSLDNINPDEVEGSLAVDVAAGLGCKVVQVIGGGT
jgi:hypothetical protein